MKKFYHIYVNEQCIHSALTKVQLNKQLTYIKGFLELTNLEDKANIEIVECEYTDALEASY